MVHLYAFISSEFKRMTGKRNLVIMLCLFILLILAVNQGINQEKQMPNKSKKFIQIQKKYFENATNYDGYGRDGVTMLFVPAATAVFFKNNIIPRDLTARVDSVVTMQVSSNMKGKSLISRLFFGPIDAGMIILLGITLLAMFYGYETPHNYRFMMFLSGIMAKASLLPALIFSRFLAFTTGLLVVVTGLMFFIHTRGVGFTGPGYHGLSILFLLTLAMMLVFFLIGFTLGTLPSVKGGLFLLFLIWIVVVIAVPAALVSAHEDNFPDVIADFQTALNKFDNVINFEKESKRERGEFNRNDMETAIDVIEKYWSNYSKNIEAEEVKLKKLIDSNIYRINKWGVLFPTTFFMLTCNEVSSCGYRSFIDFLIYVIDMMRKFVHFWIDRVFYHDPKQLVNFIKKDEHVYRARPGLPPYADAGFAALLFYILAMYITGSSRFKKWLFPGSKRKKAFAGIKINFEPGKITTVRSYDTDFYRQLLKYLLNKTRVPNWSVCIDGKVIDKNNKPTILYLPNPDTLPKDLKTRQLLYFLKKVMKLPDEKFQEIKNSLDSKILDQRFANIEKIEKAKLLLRMALMTNKQVYIFDNFVSGIPDTLRWELAKILEENTGKNTTVIDLVSNGDSWLNHDNMITVIYKNNKYEIFPRGEVKDNDEL
jgi:hypothetical protein